MGLQFGWRGRREARTWEGFRLLRFEEARVEASHLAGLDDAAPQLGCGLNRLALGSEGRRQGVQGPLLILGLRLALEFLFPLRQLFALEPEQLLLIGGLASLALALEF